MGVLGKFIDSAESTIDTRRALREKKQQIADLAKQRDQVLASAQLKYFNERENDLAWNLDNDSEEARAAHWAEKNKRLTVLGLPPEEPRNPLPDMVAKMIRDAMAAVASDNNPATAAIAADTILSTVNKPRKNGIGWFDENGVDFYNQSVASGIIKPGETTVTKDKGTVDGGGSDGTEGTTSADATMPGTLAAAGGLRQVLIDALKPYAKPPLTVAQAIDRSNDLVKQLADYGAAGGDPRMAEATLMEVGKLQNLINGTPGAPVNPKDFYSLVEAGANAPKLRIEREKVKAKAIVDASNGKQKLGWSTELVRSTLIDAGYSAEESMRIESSIPAVPPTEVRKDDAAAKKQAHADYRKIEYETRQGKGLTKEEWYSNPLTKDNEYPVLSAYAEQQMELARQGMGYRANADARADEQLAISKDNNVLAHTRENRLAAGGGSAGSPTMDAPDATAKALALKSPEVQAMGMSFSSAALIHAPQSVRKAWNQYMEKDSDSKEWVVKVPKITYPEDATTEQKDAIFAEAEEKAQRAAQAAFDAISKRENAAHVHSAKPAAKVSEVTPPKVAKPAGTPAHIDLPAYKGKVTTPDGKTYTRDQCKRFAKDQFKPGGNMVKRGTGTSAEVRGGNILELNPTGGYSVPHWVVVNPDGKTVRDLESSKKGGLIGVSYSRPMSAVRGRIRTVYDMVYPSAKKPAPAKTAGKPKPKPKQSAKAIFDQAVK